MKSLGDELTFEIGLRGCWWTCYGMAVSKSRSWQCEARMEGIEAAGGESLQLGLASVYRGSHGGKRELMEVDLRREEDQKSMNQSQR